MTIDIKTHYRILAALRQVFRFFPAVRSARAKVKVGKDLYLCQGCDQLVCNGELTELEIKELHQSTGSHVVLDKIYVDHINPVVEPSQGFIDYNTFVSRLFCGPDGLQILCTMCHRSKTMVENQDRVRKPRAKKAKKVPAKRKRKKEIE